MLNQFKQVWAVDFEFAAPSGAAPQIRCLVAKELHSGQEIKLWVDELSQLATPPYAIDENALLVAYYASAEWGCHLALRWDLPVHVLDLFVEFRNLTNGLPTLCGGGLLGALAYFGLSSIDVAEKETMRDLALRGGHYTQEEKTALLNYCETDVDALARLLPAMLPKIDLSRALLRGNYMKAAAMMEFNGIPIDLPMLELLREKWDHIQDSLIAEIDKSYGVYDGRTFKTAEFQNWLIANNIAWLHLPSGALDLSDDTFKAMSNTYPEVELLRELRATLSQMRLSDLARRCGNVA